jgi:hypothetical protein
MISVVFIPASFLRHFPIASECNCARLNRRKNQDERHCLSKRKRTRVTCNWKGTTCKLQRQGANLPFTRSWIAADKGPLLRAQKVLNLNRFAPLSTSGGGAQRLDSFHDDRPLRTDV